MTDILTNICFCIPVTLTFCRLLSFDFPGFSSGRVIFCKFLSNASFYTSNFHYPIRNFSKVFFGQLFHLHNYVFILFTEQFAGRALNIFRLIRKEFDIVCLWEIFFNCDAVKQKLWLCFLKWILRTKWWNQVDRSSFKTWSNVQEGKSETNFYLEKFPF